ncbi:MAG: hypothetical protein HY958_09100 [Bacteroidia bacterium]|nr:hypothetical protein [Bacteroidia bacterium]
MKIKLFKSKEDSRKAALAMEVLKKEEMNHVKGGDDPLPPPPPPPPPGSGTG